MDRKVVVGLDGRVRYLAHEELEDLLDGEGVTLETRVSHIVPESLLLRGEFVLLRAVFGDSGRVASWTRTWRCWWQVDLRPSDGPVVGGFLSRDSAIEFEEGWLQRRLSGG